jgi:hypothetical protein
MMTIRSKQLNSLEDTIMKVTRFSQKGLKGFTLDSGVSFIRGEVSSVEKFLASSNAVDIEEVLRETRELGAYMEAYFKM